MKSDRRGISAASVTITLSVMDALQRAKEALEGDSNDEDHDALYALVAVLEEALAGGLLNESHVSCPFDYTLHKPMKKENAADLKMVVPTYNGKWLQEYPALAEFDEPHLPVLVTLADGLRVILGTHDYDDFEKPDIQIERRHNGWLIFLNPMGAGDPSGFLVFLDDGRSYVAPECGLHDNQTIMVDYEQAVAEVDDIKPTGPSCVPTGIVEREQK